MEQTISYTTEVQGLFYYKNNHVSLRSATKVVILSQEYKGNIKIKLSVNIQMSSNQSSNSLDSKRDEGNQTKVETLPVSTQTDIVYVDGCFTQLSRCVPKMFKRQTKHQGQEETEKSNLGHQAPDGPSTHDKNAFAEDNEEEIIMKVIHPTDENAQGFPHTEDLSPLFALFPDLITTYPVPESLQSNVSTTDITRELVSLGTKADFSQLKPSSRLIPPHKVWLSALHEVPREVEKMEEVESESSDEDLGRNLEYLDDKGSSFRPSTSF